MNKLGIYQRAQADCITTFNEKIIDRATRTPNKTVFIQLNEACEETSNLSYRKLIHNSIGVSKQLLEHHKKGDRCLIAIPGGAEFITAFLGCILSGIIAVPTILPKRNKPNSRFWSIVQDSNPVCMLTSNDTRELVESQLEASENTTHIKNIVNVEISNTEYPLYGLPEIHPDDIAFLQYTSGSVGRPKGIMVSQKNLFHNSGIIKRSFNHTSKLVSVSWLPPFHDMGLIGCMLQPIFVGGVTIIIQPTDFIRNPSLWFQAISKYKATTVGCPNFGLDYCVEKITEPDVNTMDLSSLKVLFCGSEPVRENSLRSFAEKFSSLNFKNEVFLPCYGLAEATLMVSGISQTEEPGFFYANRIKLSVNQIVVKTSDYHNMITYFSCGRTWNHTEVFIVDPNTRALLPENMVGEVYVMNDSVCKGYWNKPEETDEVFNAFTKDNHKGPCLRTGDLGFLSNNQLFITGRLKELIIVRGVNLIPNDIENVVDKCHPALQGNGCAVFSIEHKNNEQLVVVQEIKRVYINNFNQDEIVQAIQSAVAEHFDASVYAIVVIYPMGLPKTTSGKIQRIECRKLYLEDNLRIVFSWQREEHIQEVDAVDAVTVTPGSIMNWIKNWLGAKLGIDPHQIKSEQPILSLGLDSITAVELESELNARFMTDIFVGDFFENNTIECIARVAFKNCLQEKVT